MAALFRIGYSEEESAKQMFLLLHLFENHNALQLLFSPSSSSPKPFQNIGEFGAKNYFVDHETTSTIQLFVATKGNFSGLFFF